MLIGRDCEVGRVLDLVADRTSCALVGEAGIGKTAVLRAVATELGGHAVLGGAVQPLRWMPYLPLQRACGMSLTGSKSEVTARAIEALGSRALLLDDLHWADPDTLEVLPEIGHEIPIVVAIRAGDVGSDAAIAVGSILGPVIGIGPLEDDAARMLVRNTVPTATNREVGDLVRGSGGNPLLLTCDPVSTDADAVDDRVLALVTRASVRAQQALACLALHGRPARTTSQDALEELLQLGLAVRTEDDYWAPRHELFGQAAVKLLRPNEKLTLHRMLAALCKTDGARARHHLHGGEPDLARLYALRAAENAASKNERADHLAIAAVPVGGVEDPDIILDAAEALAAAGRVDEGLAYAQRAEPADRLGVLRREKTIAWCAWWAAQHDLVWPALEHAVELLTPDDAAIEVTVRMLRARYLARVAWDPPAALAEARAAVDLAEREGLPVAEAYGALGSACLVSQDPSWNRWLAKSITAARVEGMEGVEVTSADTLFVAQLVSGEPIECAPLARQMIDRSRQLGSRTGETQFRKNLLMARFHVDDAVEETLTAARQLLGQPLNPRQRDHLEAHLVLACADLGLDDEIAPILANAYGFQTHDMTARSMILWVKAESDWLAGRAQEAYDTATECRALPVVGFPSHVLAEPVRQLAALDLGIDPGPAMTGVVFSNFVAANKESQAIVAMYNDPTSPDNAGKFLAATRSWDRVSRRNAARSAWLAGEAARRAGKDKLAIKILRMIEPEVRASGRKPLLRRIHATLRMLGERVAIHNAEPVPPLTAAQVEVLDLVGRGLDTRAIARRLVVSDATVESHIRQSMQRLGAPTRLAAAMELVQRRDRNRAEVAEDQTVAIASRVVDLPKDAASLADLPVTPWLFDTPVKAVGTIATEDDVARAFIAASRGASLVLHLDTHLSSATRAELLDALKRICPVEALATNDNDDIDDGLCEALRILAGGASVSEAAYEVHMSERTLHRKLSALRERLGVKSNAAAARIVLGNP